jgi:hypothetical protein
MLIAPLAFIAWAALGLALLIWDLPPIAALLSLAALAGGFEAVHALHSGAERVGRYLQVYYEGPADGPRWETAAMTVGPTLPGGGVDPLFSMMFAAGAAVNLIAALASSVPPWPELALLAAVHLAFLFRVVRARVAAARQRAVELESFKALLSRSNRP